MVKVFEANMNRNILANDLLWQIKFEKHPDLIIISELYQYSSDSYGFQILCKQQLYRWQTHFSQTQAENICGVKSGSISLLTSVANLILNKPIRFFHENMDNFRDTLREMEGNLIVAGYFN